MTGSRKHVRNENGYGSTSSRYGILSDEEKDKIKTANRKRAQYEREMTEMFERRPLTIPELRTIFLGMDTALVMAIYLELPVTYVRATSTKLTRLWDEDKDELAKMLGMSAAAISISHRQAAKRQAQTCDECFMTPHSQDCSQSEFNS